MTTILVIYIKLKQVEIFIIVIKNIIALIFAILIIATISNLKVNIAIILYSSKKATRA